MLVLEDTDIYKKYRDLKVTEILPGHVRADIAKFTSINVDSLVVLEYLYRIMNVVVSFWKGESLPLGYFCNNFSDDFAFTIAAGAGAMSYSDLLVKYTEDGVPSGVFDSRFRPPRYHPMRIKQGWISLDNQNAGVAINVLLYDADGTFSMYTIMSETLDATKISMRDEGTNYRDIPLGYGQQLAFYSGAEIDLDTVAHLHLIVELL